MNRFFHFKDEKSDKFWEINYEGELQTVRFGRSGTRGQIAEKSFETAEACEKDSLVLIKEKTKKGYQEVSVSTRLQDEIELEPIGGVTPLFRFEDEMGYLIMEIPFFEDEEGRHLDGDADFPEGDVFEEILTKVLGKTVEREDREVFVFEEPRPSDVEKLRAFFGSYWENRLEIAKKQSTALLEAVIEAQIRVSLRG